MPELRALTPEEFRIAEERLRNPRPGSRIEAARKYGIDLTLLIEQLRLAPAERVRRMELAAQNTERLRGIGGSDKALSPAGLESASRAC